LLILVSFAYAARRERVNYNKVTMLYLVSTHHITTGERDEYHNEIIEIAL